MQTGRTKKWMCDMLEYPILMLLNVNGPATVYCVAIINQLQILTRKRQSHSLLAAG